MAKKKKESGLKPGLHIASQPSPNRRVETKIDDKTITLYANNANIEFTTWDVKIRLGLVDTATADLISVRDVAHVYMSHAHAKAFSDALASSLQKVEAVMRKNADVETQTTH